MTELETWLARFKTVVHFVPQTSAQLKKSLQYLPTSTDVDPIFVKASTSCIDLTEAEKVFTSYRVYNMSLLNAQSCFSNNVERFLDKLLDAVSASDAQPALFNLSSAPKWFILAIQQRALKRCDSSDAIHFAMIDNANDLIIRFNLLNTLPGIVLPEIEEPPSNIENSVPTQSNTQKTQTNADDIVEQSLPSEPKQQTQVTPKANAPSTSKLICIDHKTFPPQPQVVKRQDFVFHLWDYRQVILNGESGSATLESLKGVSISAVSSHAITQKIKIKRVFDNRTVIVNTRKKEPYLSSYKGKNSNNRNFLFKDVLPDYPKIWNYFGGAWFEDYVYLILQENKSLENVTIRYKFTIDGRQHEVDVVAFGSGCFYLLSCKTGKAKAEDVSELDELVKKLNQKDGATYKGVLCYARDVNVQERIKNREISCVYGESLADVLRTRLINLKPGVVYNK